MEDSIPNLTSDGAGQPVAGKLAVSKLIIPILVAVALGLGVFTGWQLAEKEKPGVSRESDIISQEKITKGSEFGAKDTSKLDTALGVLEMGGVDGEGTHKLLREGGPSQTLYLTSSTLDLDQFVGRKIQVWGETMTAQKAGWFMDARKIKVLE